MDVNDVDQRVNVVVPFHDRYDGVQEHSDHEILPDEQGRPCGDLDGWGELMPGGCLGPSRVRDTCGQTCVWWVMMIQNASQTAPAAYPPMTSLMK